MKAFLVFCFLAIFFWSCNDNKKSVLEKTQDQKKQQTYIFIESFADSLNFIVKFETCAENKVRVTCMGEPVILQISLTDYDEVEFTNEVLVLNRGQVKYIVNYNIAYMAHGIVYFRSGRKESLGGLIGYERFMNMFPK